MHETYSRRRPNQLSRQLRDTNSQHDPIQNPCQKHPIHPECQMHHDRHQRLLSANPNEETGVHKTEDHRYTGRGHQTLQFEVVSNTRRIWILWNNKGDVWLTSSKDHSTGTPWKTTSRVWIPPEQDHQQFLEKFKTRPICFCLVVDNFAVKYVNQDDAVHLINAVRKYYLMTVDKDAMKYIGLTIEWIMRIEKPTSICQATSRKHLRDSIMKHQKKSKTCRTHTWYHNMERRHNMP